MVSRTRVKICCIASVDEAMTAVHAGADAVGLVSAMPSGPGVIDEETIREIAEHVPPPIGTFLLTAHVDAGAIVEQVVACGVNTVQVCPHLDRAQWAILARELPRHVRRVQVIHVEDDSVVDLTGRYRDHVHAFLLDSGRPSLDTPELGGTGRVHDWAISARFVAAAGRPTFLAGGLRADNVADAIATVRPFGVDLCSGVRTGDVLDATALARFMAAVRPRV